MLFYGMKMEEKGVGDWNRGGTMRRAHDEKERGSLGGEPDWSVAEIHLILSPPLLLDHHHRFDR